MWLLVNHTKPTYLLTADNNKSASGQLQNNPVNDRDNLGKLDEKPQMIDMNTSKLIESLKLYISHQRTLYLIVKVMLGFICSILGYLGH